MTQNVLESADGSVWPVSPGVVSVCRLPFARGRCPGEFGAQAAAGRLRPESEASQGQARGAAILGGPVEGVDRLAFRPTGRQTCHGDFLKTQFSHIQY